MYVLFAWEFMFESSNRIHTIFSHHRTNRKSKTEIDVAGYKIPKDVDLSFAIYVLHRDPEYWTDPEKFDPER